MVKIIAYFLGQMRKDFVERFCPIVLELPEFYCYLSSNVWGGHSSYSWFQFQGWSSSTTFLRMKLFLVLLETGENYHHPYKTWGEVKTVCSRCDFDEWGKIAQRYLVGSWARKPLRAIFRSIISFQHSNRIVTWVVGSDHSVFIMVLTRTFCWLLPLCQASLVC